MADDLDTDIRRALDERAHEVDVPVDLARRTMELARTGAKPSLRDRLRALTDAWRIRVPIGGLPRWLYAGAAAAAALALFGVGTLVTRPAAEKPTPAALESKAESGPDQSVSSGAATIGRAAPDIAPVPPVPSRPGQFPPKIVRTASIDVQVGDFDRAWRAANDVAGRYDGFVTNSQSGDRAGTLTMRVPAAKLDAALRDLRRLGKVESSNTSAEDVSGAIVDVDARLRASQAEELQLLELLRRANAVSEVLAVRDRLNSIRQEIESLKAQKANFVNQVDYATVNATVHERGASSGVEPEEPGILSDAWHTALRVGQTVVAGMLVVLAVLVPLTALGVIVWLGVRTARRRSA